MKIAGKTILQGELVDVLECEKCGARWTNQLMECYHCAASLKPKIRCIHTDYDICYCGCPKCEIDCTIEKQKNKNNQLNQTGGKQNG